jgi:hypothetical protein
MKSEAWYRHGWSAQGARRRLAHPGLDSGVHSRAEIASTLTLRISALQLLTTATCIPPRLKMLASADTERLGVLRGI